MISFDWICLFYLFFFSERSVLSLECKGCPLAASCPFQWRRPVFLCVPAGNTLCKSGSIAVFGNVVYSGLLNDHLWHLGVPLFTRLVRAAAPSVCTYLRFVRRFSHRRLESNRQQVENSPKPANGLFFWRFCWHVSGSWTVCKMLWVKVEKTTQKAFPMSYLRHKDHPARHQLNAGSTGKARVNNSGHLVKKITRF